MGSTNITELSKMFVQGNRMQTQGASEPKKEGVTVRFQKIMDGMSAQLSGGIKAQQNQTLTAADPASDKGVETDYENISYNSTKIRTADSASEMPDQQETKDALEKFEEDVREILKEELGVTDEQISEAMEMLGISALDLMNPNQLALLTSELSGSKEAGDMLFDACFLQVMQKTEVLGQELLQELGISKEELAVLCKESAVSSQEQPIAPAETTDFAAGEQTLPKQPNDLQPELLAGNETADTAVNDETQAMKTPEAESAKIPVQTEETTAVHETMQDGQTIETVTGAVAEERTPVEAAVKNDETNPVKQPEPTMTDGMEQTVQEEALPQKNLSDQQSSQQNSSMQHGQPEHAAAFVNHAQTIEVPVAQLAPEQVGYSEQIDLQNVIREIVEFAKVHVTQQESTLQMQLNPEHLGKVFLELTARDGAVSAKIFAQNEMVKEALEVQMADLRQNMSQAGIKVEAIEVTVESHEFERNLEQQANQERQQAEQQEKARSQTRKINLSGMESLDELSGMMTEEEALVARIMADRGNSIDYTA